MTVVVLSGGLSHERDVSLRSGRRVSKALRDKGRDVVEADVNADLVSLLNSLDNPVVFPLLHGGLGEDGALAEVLALLDVPFVGPDAHAARVTFDKSIATTLVAHAGLRTPRQVALPHDIFRELGAAPLMDAIVARLGRPLMVKPAASGSALGCAKVNELSELPTALVAAYAYGPLAVIEEFITGTEVAIGILDVAGEPRALPAVEIRPTSGVYDYAARYTAGATRFVTPAELPDSVAAAASDLALEAHRVLGLGQLSRIDVIITEAGEPVFIEGNVAPGMTETSLVPLAIAAAGLDLGDVMCQLVDEVRR